MPITKPVLTKDEQEKLVIHSIKHKTYPYSFRWKKTINGTNFATADAGSLGSYFTLTFQTKEILPVISIAANFIVTPNTTVGTFAVVMSYKPTLSFADNANTGVPDDEAGDIYKLLSNGGAINDFQVFYPLNWYLDRNAKVYVHVFADSTTVSAGTSTMVGQVILGTIPTGA